MATVRLFDGELDATDGVASEETARPFTGELDQGARLRVFDPEHDALDAEDAAPPFLQGYAEALTNPTGYKPAPGEMEAVPAPVRAVPRGAVETAATAIEPVALSRDISRDVLQEFTARARSANRVDDTSFSSLLSDITRSDLPPPVKSQVIQTARNVRAGRLSPEEVPDFAAGTETNRPREVMGAMREFAETAFPLSPEEEQRLPVQVARGVGSAGAFIATRLLPGGQAMLPVFAGSVGAGEAIERAMQNGATNDEAAQAALLGVAPGLTDIIPIERLFKPLVRSPGVKGALYALARKMIEQGAVEGTQEGVQSFMQNVIERLTTDKNQALLENTGKDVLVGTLVGMIFGAGGAGVQMARRDPEKEVEDQVLSAPDVDSAIAAAEEAAQGEPLALPAPRMIVTPDGEAATEAQILERETVLGVTPDVSRAATARAAQEADAALAAGAYDVPPGATAPSTPAALPPPRVVVSQEGTAATEAQMAQRQAERIKLGLTPDVERVVSATQAREAERVARQREIDAAFQTEPAGAVRPNRFLRLLAEHGGISRADAEAQGIDPAHFSDATSKLVFGKPLFPKTGGMTFDEAAEFASQFGYGSEQYSANELLSLLDDALRGNEVVSRHVDITDLNARMEAQRRRYYDEIEAEPDLPDVNVTPTELAVSGYNKADETTRDLSALYLLGRQRFGDEAFDDLLERVSTQHENVTDEQFEAILRQEIESHAKAQAGPEQTPPAREGGGADIAPSVPVVGAAPGEEATAPGAGQEVGRGEDPAVSPQGRIAAPVGQGPARDRGGASGIVPEDEAVGARPGEVPGEAAATDVTEQPAVKPATAGTETPPQGGVSVSAIDKAAREAATSPENNLPEPTEAQKDAGNYQLGHASVNGLDISVENPAGSRRRPEWKPLVHHYGYIKGTVGKDKDHIDVFLSDRADDAGLPVFVVDQVNKNGAFDEHKVMLGFENEEAARQGYLANYEDGWTGLGAIKQFTFPEFKLWLKAGNTKKPVALDKKEQQLIPVSKRGKTESQGISPEARKAAATVTTEAPSTDQEVTAPAVEPPASAQVRLAEVVRDRLRQAIRDRKPITWQDLFAMADETFGGTQAQGTYSVKDAYDAMELGVNLYLSGDAGIAFNPHRTSRVENATEAVNNLRALMDLLPTQSKRTEEQLALQQFSTPHMHAWLAAWVSRVGPNDTALEPSAGTGDLVVHAMNAGATVHANELAPRRAEALKALVGEDRVSSENAAHIHALLPQLRPTVVLMNPPFSADVNKAGRMDTSVGATHVEAALKKLSENGRLVAILGRGMALDRPAFRSWWEKIRREYNVRANIGIAGKEYAKYGTSFDNVIVVIDKTGPTVSDPVTGEVERVEFALPMLETIRNDRVAVTERQTSEPAGEARPEGIRRDAGSGESVRAPTDVPRTTDGAGRTTAGESGRPDVGRRDADDVRSGEGAQVSPGERIGRVDADAIERTPAEARTGQPAAVQPEGQARRDPVTEGAAFESADPADDIDVTASVFETYRPSVSFKGSKDHPTRLAESAAMASIKPPPLRYRPNIPDDLIASGRLSNVQLEGIAYAGQAHENLLPNGQRRGFFIGDGTGVGKGAQNAGIILDNWRQGRRKAVWVSENQKLMNDAERDLKWVGFDPDKMLFAHADLKGDIKAREGVMFTTYDTLRSQSKEIKDEAGNVVKAPDRRIDQLITWLGDDFDGVIIYDESHNLGNSIDQKGQRGVKKAAAKALAGVELQQRLPKARIVYASATGATEVENLAYAERLGLWGEGTAFSSKEDFIDQIKAGGVAAMEVVAKDLKAMGVYVARSLAYQGPKAEDNVSYETLEHKLTPNQEKVFNALAGAWQKVLNNVNEALASTGVVNEDGKTLNGRAKSAALSAFWGSHQRFFNQVITAMQMPSVVADIEKKIEAGESAVLQLVNTNEAVQERRLAQAAAADMELDDLDLTPRDILIQYITKSFPTSLYEEYTDDDGNVRSRPVQDSKGNPVQDPDAIAMRDALIEELASIPVPEGVLEQLLNHFGSDAVAEITGRKRRLVREKKTGKMIEEKRSDSRSNLDANEFMRGKRRILVFSDAGGTGRSYHADLRSPNQQKRNHYLVQPGWRADKAMQGFGRTHRTNQKQSPHYILVTTNLKAQRRFLSSIARRLDQLGALTKGQRETGSQGLFSAEMNLENQYAVAALENLVEDVYGDKVSGVTLDVLQEQMGLRLTDENGQLLQDISLTVPRFLNRLLSLSTDTMDKVFDAFFARLQANVEYARQAGTLDTGLETIAAQTIEKIEDKVVRADETGSGETRYVRLRLTNPTKLIQFDDLPKDAQFARNTRSGKLYAFVPATHATDVKTGSVIERMRRISQSGGDYVTRADFAQKYTAVKASAEQARALWDQAVAQEPKTVSHDLHLITGALLPVWDRLGNSFPRIKRARTKDGERVLGREITSKEIAGVLKALGVSADAPKKTPAEFVAGVLRDGDTLVLANGWQIGRRRVSGENRIEILNTRHEDKDLLKKQGAFVEVVAYKARVFIPTDRAADVLKRITDSKPVVEVIPLSDEVSEPGLQEGVAEHKVGEDEDTPYQTDLFGDPLPQRDRPRRRTTASRDVPAAVAVQLETEADNDGIFAVETALISERSRRIPAIRVRTARDAAFATAFLGRYADEHVDGLVTDANGTPIAVIGAFKGTITGAAVYPQTLLYEAVRLNGARHIWLSHNHPSGTSDLSRADEVLADRVAERFEGSGIKVEGIMAIGNSPDGARTYTFRKTDTLATETGLLGHELGEDVAPRTSVPIVERILTKNDRLADPIESPHSSLDAIPRLAGRSSGIVLLNNRHAPVGFLPLDPGGTERLKDTPALRRIYRALSRANAAAAIVANPNGAFSNAQARNIVNMLATNDVRPLDIISYDWRRGKISNKVSAAEHGTVDTSASFFELTDIDREQEAHRGQTKEAPEVEKLHAAVEEATGKTFPEGSFTAAGVPDAVSGLAEAIKRVFGKDVVFFRNNVRDRIAFNGMVPKGDRRTIYVDIDSSRPLPYVVGHELLHLLRNEHKDIYNRVYRMALDEFRPEAVQGFARWLDRGRRDFGLRRPSEDLIHEEMMANFFGDNLADPAFWGRLAEKEPGIFRRFADVVRQLLNRLLMYAKGRGYRSDKYFRDLERMRDAATEALAEYGRRTRQSESASETDGTSFDLDDLRTAGRAELIRRGRALDANFDARQPTPQLRAAVERLERARPAAPAPDDAPPAPPTATGEPGSPHRASWDGPERSKIDTFIAVMQDKHIDTKRVVQAIKNASGALRDATDAYLQEELYHGRAAKRVQDFLDMELRPLLQEMAMRRVTMAELEEYLHARHAEERNAQIARINPDMPDGGSGMTNAEARAYLDGLDPAKQRVYEALVRRVDTITRGTRETLIAYGLESPDTIATWEAAYEHYVPLFREDMENAGLGTGQGYSVRGPASRRATGSGRRVVDILANIAQQRERAITRGEKNRVSLALVGLAAENANPDFWKVDRPPTEKVVDPRTGLVVTRVDPLYKSRPNVIVARAPNEGGKIIEHFVVFNQHDERAMRMAEALKNLDGQDLGELLSLGHKATRYFASINTQYNPVFGVINMTRDVQGAILNLTSTPIRHKQHEVLKHTLSALRGIYIDVRSARSGEQPRSTWAALWDEFQREGGQTGYRELFRTSKTRAEAIEREIRRALEGKAKVAGRAVFDWLSDYNLAMENAVRLAAYKVAKEQGISNQRAASLAKNLTVNFNRRGQIGTQAGALYAFFNASVQGTARMAQTLTGPAGRKILIGGTLLGVIQAIALAMAGFDEDEPPEFVRARNLIIPIGGKRYITIPMPLGFHVIPNLGRIPTEFAIHGFRGLANRIVDLLDVTVDAFNPVGSAGLSLQTIAPTVIDPIAALAENKDWTGRPIALEDMSSLAPTPGHTRVKDTASEFSRGVSWVLNRLSGGTQYTPGVFSPTPDQIDYLVGQLTGGVGREYMKLEQTLTSIGTGEELPVYKIPLFGRYYGSAEGQAPQANTFYNNIRSLNMHEAEVKGRLKSGEPTDGYYRAHPEARLWKQANSVYTQVSKLRQHRRNLVERGEDRARIRAIDDRITLIMRNFNERVERARESP